MRAKSNNKNASKKNSLSKSNIKSVKARKQKMKKEDKSFLHYTWVPFANMDFHLFVFDCDKVEDWKIWKYAFCEQHPVVDNHQYPGMTCYDTSYSTYTCAVSLMKNEDGSIDLTTIVHECVHVTQHYINLLKMNSKDDEPTNGEFGPEICSALVVKIIEILQEENIGFVNRYDMAGLDNVRKVTHSRRNAV